MYHGLPYYCLYTTPLSSFSIHKDYVTIMLSVFVFYKISVQRFEFIGFRVLWGLGFRVYSFLELRFYSV